MKAHALPSPFCIYIYILTNNQPFVRSPPTAARHHPLALVRALPFPSFYRRGGTEKTMRTTTMMAADKEEELGLSLSLSLSFANRPNTATTGTSIRTTTASLNHHTTAIGSNAATTSNRNLATRFELNLSPRPPRKNTLNNSHRSSEACRVEETRSSLSGIDVNRLLVSADEEEAGVSSPNSTISSVSGKRSETRESNNDGFDDNDADRTSSRGGGSDEEEGDASRKKLRLSKAQAAVLEETFTEHHTLNPKQKAALARRLGLRPRQVEVWFQNRRARTKLKQTEVDCQFLKRCCELLTEENRRLHKEVQDLRALKLSPQFYMQMSPPTTLSMCPSCERVGASPSTAASSAFPQPADSRRDAMANPAYHLPVPVNPRLPPLC
ncbi:hypothetical protein Dimus_034857 [Dionaea muscipula]